MAQSGQQLVRKISHIPIFLACFNPNGEAIWKREDTRDSAGMSIYNLLFDTDNSIYLGGSILGFNFDSFMGFSVPLIASPGYIMKIDAMATAPIWSTYHNKGAIGYGAIAMKGNELTFTDYCGGNNFTWGTQTFNATGNNEGNDVLFARFNKNNGDCLSLTKIPGNIGYEDYGCALAVDRSGDYIVGGNFSSTLTFDSGVQVINNGGQSDFFIAKYATQACSPLGVAENTFQNLTHYPNPTTGLLMLDSQEPLQYELYDLKGSLFANGAITVTNSSVDLSALPSGTYVLKIQNERGQIKEIKVAKNKSHHTTAVKRNR